MNHWKEITFICGNHGADKTTEMIPVTDGYICPRNQDSDACPNRLTLNDVQNAVLYLKQKAENGYSPYEINLQGLRFRLNNVDYQVLEHQTNKMVVCIFNHKTVR